MKRTSFSFLFAVGAILLLGACKDGSVSGIGGGGNGGSTASGGGGNGGNEPGCKGDKDAWAAMTEGPFTCQKNSDCCVVVNGCLAQAQIVKATDYATAADTWYQCGDDCVLCIPPAINVACVNGLCVGEEVDLSTDPPPDLMKSHCGEDAVIIGTPASVTKFGCGP